VIASKGHIRDLGEKEMDIDVAHGYACNYHIVDGKAPLIAQLKSELAKSDRLLLATDEDREGESISWHLLQVLKPKVPYQRMVFHEITKSAIEKALTSGRDVDENLVQAQEGRRVVDRLYGYSISPILWKKLANKKLSAGRVQSVCLRLTMTGSGNVSCSRRACTTMPSPRAAKRRRAVVPGPDGLHRRQDACPEQGFRFDHRSVQRQGRDGAL
jgi:DNA topoisomerase-1